MESLVDNDNSAPTTRKLKSGNEGGASKKKVNGGMVLRSKTVNLTFDVEKSEVKQSTDRERKPRSKQAIYTCPECERPFRDTGKLTNHRRLAHRILETPIFLTQSSSGCSVEAGSGSSVQGTDKGHEELEEEEVKETTRQPSSSHHFDLSHARLSILRLIEDCETYSGEKNVEMEDAGAGCCQKAHTKMSLNPPLFLFPSNDCDPESKSSSENMGFPQVAHLSEEGTEDKLQTATDPLQPPENATPHFDQRQVHFNIPTTSGGDANGDANQIMAGFRLSTFQIRQCPVLSCQMEFSTRGAFINHLECHEGKKPFPCPVCHWGCTTEIQLLEHFSTKHSKEPIFKCGGCGKSYKTQRGCNNHKILKQCNTPSS